MGKVVVMDHPLIQHKIGIIDDNGTGFTDNGDGTWSDENGNSYTEMN